MHTRLAAFAFLICVAAPALASAQSPVPAESWTFSPMLGIAFDPDADASLSIAGAVGYQLTDNFAVEGELAHVFDMAPGDADVDSSLTTAHANALYFLNSDYELRVYLTGGLGAGHVSHNVDLPPANFERTEVGFNLGAGVTYPLDDRMAFRGDFRYMKHIDNVPSVWRFSGGVMWRISE